MDPLSVAASIAGLATAGAQIISLLQGFIDAPTIAQTVGVEINHFIVVLAQLQPFVFGSLSADQSRTSMIEVQQIQIVLTGCVITFSELQAAVNGLGEGSTGKISIRGRLKWVMAESTITQYVQRLRDHKCSLTLILTVLTCKSTSQAVDSITELRGLLEQYIQQNTELFNRILELETEPPTTKAYSVTGSSIRSWTSFGHNFEPILFDSHLYRRVLKKNRLSSTGSRPSSVNWSILSGFSLSQVSNIAVFRLAVSPADISNPECYSIVPKQLQTTVTEMVRQRQELEHMVFPGKTSPLHIACWSGDHETVRELLEVAADVEARDEHGNTPLHLASRAGHHKAVRFLLESGADVEAKRSFGERPLHVAAGRPVLDTELDMEYDMTTQVLLELGANPDERTESNRTALHGAVWSGQAGSARALLRAGADRTAMDALDWTPAQTAHYLGHVDMARLLEEWGTSETDGLKINAGGENCIEDTYELESCE